MLVPMTKVRILGRRDRLVEVLDHLYRLRLVQLEDVTREPGLELVPTPGGPWRAAPREELRLLLARLDGLLALAPAPADALGPSAEPPEAALNALSIEPDALGPSAEPPEAGLDALSAQLDALGPRVEELTGRVEALGSEEVVVGRYVDLLRRVLELVPELEELDAELVDLRLGTVVLMLGSEDESVAELLRSELRALLGGRFLLVSAPVEGALGCVLVYPLEGAAAVEELLDRRRVRQLPVPEAYRDLSMLASLELMEQRLTELPEEIARAQAELEASLRPHVPGWVRARAALAARLELIDAVGWVGTTERVFVAAAWLPRRELARLRAELERRVGPEVVVEELPASRRDPRAPVALHNPKPARPFEFVVRFYDDPRARSLDPTGLMALFVPLMFGLMVGDVAYGALLLAVAIGVRAKLGPRSPAARDASLILALGSVYAILFGFVFGELLGDLGERAFGMPALWRHRDDASALQPLLLFALAIGAAHVVLGYLLALVQSWRDRTAGSALAPGGSLLVLAGLFAIAGVAGDQLPTSALGPAGAVAVIGLVVASAAHGWLGMVIGPLELVGTIGSVLSYLRLAAVGLASVYLAVVANELASVGPIWIGVVVAAFLHALNLALAGFTPAVQSLRLQYVEFFGTFFIGGGKAFRPFGARDASGPSTYTAAAGSGA